MRNGSRNFFDERRFEHFGIADLFFHFIGHGISLPALVIQFLHECKAHIVIDVFHWSRAAKIEYQTIVFRGYESRVILTSACASKARPKGHWRSIRARLGNCGVELLQFTFSRLELKQEFL